MMKFELSTWRVDGIIEGVRLEYSAQARSLKNLHLA